MSSDEVFRRFLNADNDNEPIDEFCSACKSRAVSYIPSTRWLGGRRRRHFSQRVRGIRKESLHKFIVQQGIDDPQDSEGLSAQDGKATEAEAASGPTSSAGSSKEEEEYDKKCAICLDYLCSPAKVKLCGHVFCRGCLEQSFKVSPRCPLCNQYISVAFGNMPDGTMDIQWFRTCLPGHEDHGTIAITYSMPDGIQSANHTNPGSRYYGTVQVAYLPDSKKGRLVCRLLWVAFRYRHTFTLVHFPEQQLDNQVIWNDIHHKINTRGGPENYGYPDPGYLSRVTEELAAKGITPEFIKNFSIPF